MCREAISLAALCYSSKSYFCPRKAVPNLVFGETVSNVASKTSPPYPIPRIIPFLKWPGGKRWLISNYSSLLDVEFKRYVEPFLGGGAVFFHLAPTTAVLSDINRDLIACYDLIKQNWQDVWCILKRHQRLHGPKYYYEERSCRHRTPEERAAQLIYLNRTCWNGLYRVNLNGQFNVPIGTKDSVLLDSDDFKSTSALLQGADLRVQDFEVTIGSAGLDDFIFVDPPYTVKHDHNGFLKYNETIFSWDDQKRLLNALLAAKSRGAKILLLNANHHSVQNLYRELGPRRTLTRNSVLSGDAAFRGLAKELAIYTEGPEE